MQMTKVVTLMVLVLLVALAAMAVPVPGNGHAPPAQVQAQSPDTHPLIVLTGEVAMVPAVMQFSRPDRTVTEQMAVELRSANYDSSISQTTDGAGHRLSAEPRRGPSSEIKGERNPLGTKLQCDHWATNRKKI